MAALCSPRPWRGDLASSCSVTRQVGGGGGSPEEMFSSIAHNNEQYLAMVIKPRAPKNAAHVARAPRSAASWALYGSLSLPSGSGAAPQNTAPWRGADDGLPARHRDSLKFLPICHFAFFPAWMVGLCPETGSARLHLPRER